MPNEKIASLLLRIGLVLVFLYAAVAAIVTPTSWIGFFPQFLRDIVPVRILLPAFSSFELVLTLWLLSGRNIYYAAIVASIALFGIIAVNIFIFDIIFRDVAILFAALALAALSKPPAR